MHGFTVCQFLYRRMESKLKRPSIWQQRAARRISEAAHVDEENGIIDCYALCFVLLVKKGNGKTTQLFEKQTRYFRIFRDSEAS